MGVGGGGGGGVGAGVVCCEVNHTHSLVIATVLHAPEPVVI